MPATWACITSTGVVGNCIVADADFVTAYLPQSGFTAIISIDSVAPQPGPGWTYDGTSFAEPVIPDPPELLPVEPPVPVGPPADPPEPLVTDPLPEVEMP